MASGSGSGFAGTVCRAVVLALAWETSWGAVPAGQARYGVARPAVWAEPVPGGRYRVQAWAARAQAGAPGAPLYARLAVRPGMAAVEPATPPVQALKDGQAVWVVTPAAGVPPEAIPFRVDLSPRADASILWAGRTASLAGPRPPGVAGRSAAFPGAPAKTEGTGELLFAEDCESGAAGWEAVIESGSASWGLVRDPHTVCVWSPTISPGLVRLPDAGCLPHAHGGAACFWFGSASVSPGTFLGEYVAALQAPLGGGTSVCEQEGLLLSPPIDLTGVSAASLHFWTWWEVEGIDVAEGEFDQMQIHAVTASGERVCLGAINPRDEDEGQAFRPYSSGGPGLPGVWVPVRVDLSPFAGERIRLAFRFDSEDVLYNGFRGWFVDDIRVTGGPGCAPAVTGVVPPAGAGGGVVRVTGAGFVLGAAVWLGGSQVSAAVVSEAEIQIDVPAALEPGRYEVRVTNPDGQSAALPDAFEVSAGAGPVVLAIAPASGPAHGGGPAEIVGSGFVPGAQVLIGGYPAPDAVVLRSDRISCTLPAELGPGFHNVTVVNPDGLRDTLLGGYEATEAGGQTPLGFVHVLDARPASWDAFPLVRATVLVDTPAGLEGRLNPADFSLAEDGVPQVLTSLCRAACGGSAADIVFVVDEGGSLGALLEGLPGGLERFARTLAEAGIEARFALISFGADEAAVVLPFSSSPANLVDRAATLSAGGGGVVPRAALDAVWRAVTELRWRPDATRYVALITDAPARCAEDGSGTTQSMAETASLVEALGASVFALGPALAEGSGRGPKGGASREATVPGDVRALAETTGGVWADVAAVTPGAWLDWLAAAVASTYTLTYASANPARDGTWREVAVTVPDPWGGGQDPGAPAPVTGCGTARYQAPDEAVGCTAGEGSLAALLAIGWEAPEYLPRVRATVRVATPAAASGGLPRARFEAAEDGLRQPVLSVEWLGPDTAQGARGGPQQSAGGDGGPGAGLYAVVYAAREGTTDGGLHRVLVRVLDPVAGPQCAEGSYGAPLAPSPGDRPEPGSPVRVLGVQPADGESFGLLSATVRVDTPAGLEGTLPPETFALSEDGVPRPVSAVRSARAGASTADVVFCVDTTASMSEMLAAFREGVGPFLTAAAGAGVDMRAALVSFGDEARLEADFTASPDAFLAAVGALQASGGGDPPEASLEAVMLALSPALNWRFATPRLVVVVTDAPAHYRGDGAAFPAYVPADAVLAAWCAGASVSALGPALGEGAAGLRPPAPGVPFPETVRPDDIRALVEATGGLWADAATTRADVFLAELAELLARLYAVTWTTANTTPDGTWRQVTVSVSDPDRGRACGEGWYRAPQQSAGLLVEPARLEPITLTGTTPATAAFRVASASGSPVEYTVEADSPWLSVEPASGLCARQWQEHRVTFDAAGLLPGVYEGQITIAGPGQTRSVPVRLTVTDVLVTRDIFGDCFRAGEPVDVSVTIRGSGALRPAGVTLLEALPDGWAFVGPVCASPMPEVRSGAGETEILFEWGEPVVLPAVLIYRVLAAAPAAGVSLQGMHCFSGRAAVHTDSGALSLDVGGESCLALTDCSRPCVPHRADRNGNWAIDLVPELTRLIQFYNRRGYHTQDGTEDGYAPGPGATNGPPHQADLNGDWVLQLSPELTRVIQLYNSGGYRCAQGTEDGYAPLPVSPKASAGGSLAACRAVGEPRSDSDGIVAEVSVVLSCAGPASMSCLAVEETLPDGWWFAGVDGGPDAPLVTPSQGDAGTIGFAWVRMPASWPVKLVYKIRTAAPPPGPAQFCGHVLYREAAGENKVAIANAEVFGNRLPEDPEPERPQTLGPELPPDGPQVTVDADAAARGMGLWDFTGAYATTAADCPVALGLTHDTRGRVSGFARCAVGENAVLAIPVHGTVRGADGCVVMRLHLRGGALPEGAPRARVDLTVALDPAAASLDGVAAGILPVAPGQTRRLAGPVHLPVAEPMDGSWTLQADFGSGEHRLPATGRIALANGVCWECRARARLRGTLDVLGLALVPADPLARGLGVQVEACLGDTEAPRVRAVRCKGFGQDVRW